MQRRMPACGLPDAAQWPNSCNLNCYADGTDSIDWHADDEDLFRGLVSDCRIISLSLGQDTDDGESIFKLVDQLERGDKKPADINQHLDVVQYQGNFLFLSNRRFAALIMHQSLHRDRVVKARCRICSSNTEEFDTKYSTASDGLGVDVRHGDAQHFGATLFQRGDYVMHELEQLQQRHPENDISAAIARIRTRSSAAEPDGCSISQYGWIMLPTSAQERRHVHNGGPNAEVL